MLWSRWTLKVPFTIWCVKTNQRQERHFFEPSLLIYRQLNPTEITCIFINVSEVPETQHMMTSVLLDQEPLAVRHMLPSRIVSTIFSCPWPRTCLNDIPIHLLQARLLNQSSKTYQHSQFSPKTYAAGQQPHQVFYHCVVYQISDCITSSIYIVPTRIIFDPIDS